MRFDFQHYFGKSIDEIGKSIRYGEAIDLVEELQREVGSHLSADIAGWEIAATYGDLLALFRTEAYLSVHHDPKKPPVEMLRPWSDGQADVSPEERARLKAILVASSPFRDQM